MVGIMRMGDVDEAGGWLGEVRVTGGLGLGGAFDVVLPGLELLVGLTPELLSEVVAVGMVVVEVEVDESDIDALTEEPGSGPVGDAWVPEPVSSGPTSISICRLAGRVGWIYTRVAALGSKMVTRKVEAAWAVQAEGKRSCPMKYPGSCSPCRL